MVCDGRASTLSTLDGWVKVMKPNPLDLLVAASSYIDKWGLVDVGQLGPAARLGWFIPGRTGGSWPPLRDHWKVFRDRKTIRPFLLTSEQEKYVRACVRPFDRWETKFETK